MIQIITDKNNFHELETAVFFKWIFKTACTILIVTNTWNIVMGVFDVAQGVVNQADVYKRQALSCSMSWCYPKSSLSIALRLKKPPDTVLTRSCRSL